MTLKMYQIIDFPVFFEKVKSQPLPFKTSYRLTLLANKVQEHANFYQEKFRELILEYSQKDENGNPVPTEDGQGVKLMEDKTVEAQTKLIELQQLDVEIPNVKFSIEDFGNVELTVAEMNVIIPFIEE